MLSFYGSVRASKARAWANNRRRSLRAQIATHLGDPSEDTVLVVGGGYLGSRAGVGSKVTPVLQCLLRELSKTWRVVVVDEVTRLGCSRARARAPPPPPHSHHPHSVRTPTAFALSASYH